MRLLRIEDESHNGQTPRFSLFEPESSEDIPDYAILSHCWRDEEVLFVDMAGDGSNAQAKKGYQKLVASCRVALENDLQYLWCDTCCIDKSSSAELSEAINSMYDYYLRSELCITYLDDIEYISEDKVSLGHAKWFTRGWTLQELIAPREIYFYSRNWKFLGTKETLMSQLIEASGVQEVVLLQASQLKNICVSEKMSWAANRTTKRLEDRAYSLLGLFGIRMSTMQVHSRISINIMLMLLELWRR
jgi:hypothetical protein